jgi:hypothetical protein
MDQELDEKLEEFQEWIVTQPELPQKLGKTQPTQKLNITINLCVLVQQRSFSFCDSLK